jgi:hypothetical protein
MVAEGARFGIWIDARRMRGQDVPEDAGDLVFRLPEMPAEWQFLIDVIPTQLAAERLAHLSGVDCDSFRLCSYTVENEWGLLHENVGAAMKDNDIGFSKEVAIKKLKK